MIKGGINLYIELQECKLDQIVQEKHKNFSRQAYSFLEVMLRRLRRKTLAGKYVARGKNQVSNTFAVNAIFCPSKANTWRLKNISCNRNEPKQCTKLKL